MKNHKFLTYIFLFSLIFYFANLIKASGTIGENSRILGDNNLGKSKKCLIIYHSISGNTRRLAESLCAVLRNDYEVTTKELTRNLKSSENKMELYDLVAFGSPLHYGEFSPQMQDCILNATGLEGKKIILFVTYGTGSGRHNALLNQAVVLKNKGAAQIIKIAYLGEFTNKKNDMVNALKCALGENKNYVPTYAPLSDFYTSDTVILSGIVNYKENVLKNRARIIGVWSQKAFVYGKTPDIGIFDNVIDLRGNFSILIPKNAGVIYVGIIDCNIWGLPYPDYILNDKYSLVVKDKNIGSVSIDAIYKKVFISGAVKKNGAFLFKKDMRVLDLVKNAGGFSDSPVNLLISVYKIPVLKKEVSSLDKVSAKKRSVNILLETGDYIIVEIKKRGNPENEN